MALKVINYGLLHTHFTCSYLQHILALLNVMIGLGKDETSVFKKITLFLVIYIYIHKHLCK